MNDIEIDNNRTPGCSKRPAIKGGDKNTMNSAERGLSEDEKKAH